MILIFSLQSVWPVVPKSPCSTGYDHKQWAHATFMLTMATSMPHQYNGAPSPSTYVRTILYTIFSILKFIILKKKESSNGGSTILKNRFCFVLTKFLASRILIFVLFFFFSVKLTKMRVRAKNSPFGTGTSITGPRWNSYVRSRAWHCPASSFAKLTSRWPSWTPTIRCRSCTSAPSTWRRQKGCTSVSVRTGSFNSRSVSLRYCSHPLNYLHRFDWIFLPWSFIRPASIYGPYHHPQLFYCRWFWPFVPNYGPDRPIRRLMLISAVSKPVDEIILRGFLWSLSVDWDVVYPNTWTESSSSWQTKERK